MQGFSNSTLNADTFDLTEVELYDQNGDLITGITVTFFFGNATSGNLGVAGGGIAELVDGVKSTSSRAYRDNWSANNFAGTSYLQFDLGSPKIVASISVFDLYAQGARRFPAAYEIWASNSSDSGYVKIADCSAATGTDLGSYVQRYGPTSIGVAPAPDLSQSAANYTIGTWEDRVYVYLTEAAEPGWKYAGISVPEVTPTPVIPYGVTFTPIAGGAYSQSSVYSGNTAASAANMQDSTDGVVSTSTTATATNIEANPYIRIDYGAVVDIDCAMVRCANSNVAGGWGTFTYLKGAAVQSSVDGSTWITHGHLYASGDELGALDAPAYRLVPGLLSRIFIGASARYVQVTRPGTTGYIALQDFYCTEIETASTTPPSTPDSSAIYWRIKSLATIENYLELNELQFFSGATRLTGTYTASTAPTGGVLTSLNDDDPTTAAGYWTQAVAQNAGFWIKIQLSSAQVVTGIKQARYDIPQRHVRAFTLEYSNDDVNWTAAGSASNIADPGARTLSSLITVA
jgi:hypothetical protein